MDPQWFGDTANFVINPDKQLQLNANAAGSSCIYTANQLCDSTEWLFRIKLEFSPSLNNFARIYVMADSLGAEGVFHGYFLQFGESGSTDAITLFRDSAGVFNELCRGTSGQIASAFDLDVKLLRSKTGLWELFARDRSLTEYVFLDSASDRSIDQTQYLSIRCTYTSSNISGFLFDDFVIREIYQDIQPPQLDTCFLYGRKEIVISANESLSDEALQTNNYLLEPDGLEPDTVYWFDYTHRDLILEFPTSLQNGVHQIYIGRWCDRDSNCATNLSASLYSFFPLRWDVVINEIMTDTDPPPYGIPATDYLELFNRTNVPLLLEGWRIVVNGSQKYLPTLQLDPLGYAVISASAEGWNNAAHTYALYGLNLSSAEGEILLLDEEGFSISGLKYKRDWFQDKFREQGGWSLEQIDPSHPWATEENWLGSTHKDGGTPGKLNSVNDIRPDNILPILCNAYPFDQQRVKLIFSEPMMPEALYDPSNYLFSPKNDFSQVRKADVLDDAVQLLLAEPMDSQTVYKLRITNELMDLSGNAMDSLSISLGIATLPTQGELVINEILFNPWPGGEDFVEMLNVSKKIFDLKQLRICAVDAESKEIETVYEITEDSTLICPGEYKVLTVSRKGVLDLYTESDESAFPENLSAMPSMPDKEGGIALADYAGGIIDLLIYNENMHNSFLVTREGVSLERINPLKPSLQAGNWQSAAWTAGYATPGKQNSQKSLQNQRDDILSIVPGAITPDGDGSNDYFSLNIKPARAGALLNLQVFTENGALCKMICMSETIAEQNTFIWNGENDEGRVVCPGRYILLTQIFYEDGTADVFKNLLWIMP